MSKLRTIGGIFKVFLQDVKEDWNLMDHKLIRIGAGLAGFVLMAAFWYLFLRNTMPF